MIVGIARVRNEQDVLVQVVGHMLDECDAVIVADNNSTDGTYEALRMWSIREDRLTLVREPSFGFNQTLAAQVQVLVPAAPRRAGTPRAPGSPKRCSRPISGCIKWVMPTRRKGGWVMNW